MHSRVTSDDARILFSILKMEKKQRCRCFDPEAQLSERGLLFREVSSFFILSFSQFPVKLFLTLWVISPF